MNSPTNISHCEVTIVSEELKPEQISAELGILPDRCHVKGEQAVARHSGSITTKPSSLWAISSPRVTLRNENVGIHISFLKNILEEKLPVLQAYKSDKRMEITAWIWIETEDSGVGLDLLDADATFLLSFCNRIHFSIVIKPEGKESGS